MKKVFFTGLVAISVLSACGPSKEDYRQASNKMCECMKQPKQQKRNEKKSAENMQRILKGRKANCN